MHTRQFRISVIIIRIVRVLMEPIHVFRVNRHYVLIHEDVMHIDNTVYVLAPVVAVMYTPYNPCRAMSLYPYQCEQ